MLKEDRKIKGGKGWDGEGRAFEGGDWVKEAKEGAGVEEAEEKGLKQGEKMEYASRGGGDSSGWWRRRRRQWFL